MFEQLFVALVDGGRVGGGGGAEVEKCCFPVASRVSSPSLAQHPACVGVT